MLILRFYSKRIVLFVCVCVLANQMVRIHLTCVVIGRFPITVVVNIISRFLLIPCDFTRFPLISGDFCDFVWFLRFRMISQDSYDFSGFQWFIRISMIPCDFSRFPLISGDSPWFLVISVILHDSSWFLWFCVISRDFWGRCTRFRGVIYPSLFMNLDLCKINFLRKR